MVKLDTIYVGGDFLDVVLQDKGFGSPGVGGLEDVFLTRIILSLLMVGLMRRPFLLRIFDKGFLCPLSSLYWLLIV